MFSAFTFILFLTLALLFGSSPAFAASGLESKEWLSSPAELETDQGAAYPQMIVAEDNVYVAWTSSAIMFSRSTDAANNFSEPMKLGEYGRNISPQHMFNIAASGNSV